VSELPPQGEPAGLPEPFPTPPPIPPQVPAAPPSPPVLPTPQPDLHRSSVLLAILSGLGLALAGLVALGLFLLGLGDLARGRSSQANASSLFSIAWVSLLVAALQLPSLIHSIRRLSGKTPVEAPPHRRWLAATLCLVLMIPLVIFGQSLTIRTTSTSLLFLPPLQLAVIGLPIWWAFETGRRGLLGGSAQRRWGVVSVGTLITMPVVLIVELLAVVVFGLVIFSLIAVQPQALQQMQDLLQGMSRGAVDPQAVTGLIEPYLKQPIIIFMVVAGGAAFVPLLEEAFKPLALWFLSGRNMTPAQGFTAGLASGAVFALLESLFSLSPSMGADWSGVVIGRMGTGLLHVTCSSLVGWGLALAWRRASYFKLGGLYLLAVSLHGSWNGISLLSGFSGTLEQAQPGWMAWLGENGNWLLGLLVVINLVILVSANRYLRTHPEPPLGGAEQPPADPAWAPAPVDPPAVGI